MSQTIAIATIGTHGDVQPFVAFALALQKRGFRPVLCATSEFEGFVTEHGIAFHSLGSDIQAFLRQSQFDEAMSGGMIRRAPGLLRDGQRILREAAKSLWVAAQDADAIVFNCNTTFSIDMAEALGIPAIMTALQPLDPTTEFPYFEYDRKPIDPALTRFRREPFAKSISIDPLINRMSYFVQKAQQTYWDFPRDRLRTGLLGLRPKKRGGFYRNSKGEPVVALHAYSPLISPAPGDWPETSTITGFWPLEDRSNWRPDPAFAEFLAKGDTPIYLGFGSMPWGAQRNTEIITKALKLWGGRVVIGKGWGGVKESDLPPTVHMIGRVPHSKLFQHVKAVIHHGGAGTTHVGLAAGRPSFAVPQFFDQPYWGRLIYELGCGPMPVRLRKLTPQILAGAMEDLTSTPSYAHAAQALAEKMKLEDGPNRAVDVVEETLADFGTRRTARLAELGAAI